MRRSGWGRNDANPGSTPVVSIGIMYGATGWSTGRPRASDDPVSHAMSAVAVVVLAIAGIAVMLAPKPSGRPPGTQASQASGVAVTGGCAG